MTTGLVASDDVRDVPKIVLDVARPLRHVASGATLTDLLGTSDRAFAVNEERATEIARAASLDIPDKRGTDRSGPFILAMSSEGIEGDEGRAHGPRRRRDRIRRTRSRRSTFAAPLPWHGTAFLMGNAVAWLSRNPRSSTCGQTERRAGLRLTEGGESEVRRYVLFYMPITAVVLGVLVAPFAGARPKTRSGKRE